MFGISELSIYSVRVVFATNGVNAIALNVSDGLFLNLEYTLVAIVPRLTFEGHRSEEKSEIGFDWLYMLYLVADMRNICRRVRRYILLVK